MSEPGPVPTDGELLREFVERQSPDAFGALAERHAGLVYRACLRALDGDAPAAEDATQAAFVALARRAATVRRGGAVGAWLFRVATLSAQDIRRREARRRRREALAGRVQTEERIMGDANRRRWEAVQPHLNAALSSLRPAQQEAVLLRYLEDRTFEQVASALRCSAEAARKHAARGLEKIRAFFQKRNVTLSTAVIASGLLAEGAQAAPSGLASSACGVALASLKGGAAAATPVLAAAQGALDMIFWAQVKTAAAALAGVILLVSGGAWVYRAAAGEAPRAAAPAPVPAAPPAEHVVTGDFPVWVDLDKPQVVTVAIDDATGRRVRNLISETRLSAGRHRLSWDGFDDGTYGTGGTLARRRVEPGTYTARGLVHDGLKTVYEFTAYSGGNPPWPTKENLGGWLADHSSPLGAAFIPEGSPYGNGKPQVLLTALVAECGRTTVWVGTDGTTVQRRALWGWDGGLSAATDFGRGKDPRFYAYVLMCWGQDGDVMLRGLTRDGGADVAKFKPAVKMPKEPRELGLALSVRDGLAAIAVPLDNAIVFMDVKRNRTLGTASVPSPKGVLLDGQGCLIVSTEGALKRFALTRRTPDAAPQLDAGTVIVKGLDDPRTVQTDLQERELYVADWGRSHQVKVFSPDGRPARVIGRPGGFQVGPYDEQRMHRPCGLAIDDKGQLWVAEADWLPKRVSLWQAATGAFRSARYGPPHYGGGGTIDPEDKTRFFYAEFGGLLEFKLDWERGTSTLVAIPIRNIDLPPTRDPMPHHSYGETVPERPVHVNGRLYLAGGYQGGLRMNDTHAIYLYDDRTRTARPVCHVGSMRHWESIRTASYIGELQKESGIYEPFLCWTDRNADGRVTRDEFQVRRFSETFTKADGKPSPLFGFRDFRPGPDLSLCGSWSLRVPPPTFREDGTPLYDISKAVFAIPPADDQHWAEDGHPGVLLSDGSWLQGFKAWKDGRWIWSYPAVGETFMPPQYPGHVVEPTRLLGPPFTPGRGEARDVFCTNGERGNLYLLTGDGLFLQTLGGHMSNSELFHFPAAKRGMDVSGTSFEDEHFHPTITRTKDGAVYLVAGKEHSSIFRIDGFESVRKRAFGTVELPPTEVAKVSPAWVIPGRKQGRQDLPVAVRARAPVVDGRLDDWSQAAWAPIGMAGSAAVAVHGDRLYLAYRTGNDRALENDASDPPFAFKRGGCVDVMVGPADRKGARTEPVAGDARLLVTRVKDRTLAVLYRPVAPGVAGAKRTLFESPVGRVVFDDVREVSDAVRLAQQGGDIEVSVPLSVLGMRGQPGERWIGDLGILRGNGVQTVQRVYWNNLDTALVSDIPSEARLAPANWGNLLLTAEK